jgi:hypothetical protein
MGASHECRSANNPLSTLGSPLVSPISEGGHAADRRQRRARHRGLLVAASHAEPIKAEYPVRSGNDSKAARLDSPALGGVERKEHSTGTHPSFPRFPTKRLCDRMKPFSWVTKSA